MTNWMDQGIAAIQKHDPAYGAGDTILGLGSHMLHGAARGIGGLITLGATGSFDAATDIGAKKHLAELFAGADDQPGNNRAHD